MTENRLSKETSPYLLQHKDNPVHWWAWGPEALAEAKRTGKPILLSVGYAACHWCHVMAHESFEDEATAEVMNRLFVNIKVDREERPDVDAIYMGALHRLGEQGGWPLTMFLDSNARPFWGGTYFPKDQRYGRPAFVTVLLRIAEAFQNQPDNVASNAEKLLQSLQGEAATAAGPWLNDAQTQDLVARIARAVDGVRGGLSGAPKFPQWNVFWLLWRGALAFDDAAAKDAVILTLRNICQGGIYDHLGGGFARYSVDEIWLVPHFEKMLYDNALLIDLMTEVWRETQDPLLATRIAQTIGWLEREMIGEGGGFAASLDADSEGEEGKFYVWSKGEIDAVLGAEDAVFFNAVYGVTEGGNFEGATILNRLGATEALSPDDEKRIGEMRCKLFAERAKRVRPGWDDKILADWNGLMIAALARAATVFERPNWLDLAKRAFDHVATAMKAGTGSDRLHHAYRSGNATVAAMAADYAFMTLAAIRLFEATADAAYLNAAKRWTATLDHHNWDATSGGYFTAADDASDLVVRLKSASDDAVPSANAIQLSNLFTLHALTGDDAYEAKAEALLSAFSSRVANSPVGHCGLIAAALDRGRLVQIVATTQAGSEREEALSQVSVPGALIILNRADAGTTVPEALAAKLAADKPQTIYICRGQVCLQPISDKAKLVDALHHARSGAPVTSD